MLPSQNDSTRLSAKFLPAKPAPDQPFDAWDQDRLRAAMMRARDAEEEPDVEEDQKSHVARQIADLMADDRWRIPSEIARKLSVSEPSVRQIMRRFEEQGRARCQKIDGTYCWTFAPKKTNKGGRRDKGPWKPNARYQKILAAMKPGKWYRAGEIGEMVGLHGKQVANGMQRMYIHGAVQFRQIEGTTFFEWAKL